MPEIIASSNAHASSGAHRVALGSRVRLHFSILLASGEEIDTTRRGKPADFVMGDGNLLPGFEAALLGMRAGDDAQIALAPLQAFGEYNEANVRRLPRDQFEDFNLEEGLIVSFAGPGGELPGVVKKVYESSVLIDFNHPLAGRDVVFDVSLLRVEPGDVLKPNSSSQQ